MAISTKIDQVTDRVERLLLRHEELQRTNILLTEQLNLLTQERDSLRSRLSAARARVDALLERLLAVHGKFLLPGFLLNGGEGYLLLTPFPGRLLFRLHSVGID